MFATRTAARLFAARLATSLVTLGLLWCAPARAQAPTNDNFASRFTLTGASATTTGTNVSATQEAGEPSHAGTGGRSVWWTWVAPSSGAVSVSTAGSSFDTVLGVYTGNSVSALTLVGSNDDSGGLTSQVLFTATSGVTYQIAVDGYFGDSGSIALEVLRLSLANDNFAGRITLSGSTVSTTGSNVGATKESGEPNHGGDAGGRSVWWTWTAPSTTLFTVTTGGSSFDTLLGVYTGSSVGALTTIASNDDSLNGLASTVSFNATAGTAYQIAVDGYGGASGNISLNVTLQQPQTITFPSQATRSFVAGATFPIHPKARTAAGLPISYAGATPAICTVTGVIVTMIAPGICVVTANQIGDEDFLPAAQASAQIALTDTVQITGSRLTGATSHSCVLNLGGSVKCWGDNTYGQLGTGNLTSSATPVLAIGLGQGNRSVVAGFYHSCVLTAAGGVKCWGNNGSGELGNNTLFSSGVPVDVVGLSSGVIAIAAGASHTCALTDTGLMKCWGYNANGTLGNGSTANSQTPVDTAMVNVAQIALGTYHSCAITSSGNARCWGYNADGQVGDGATFEANVLVPRPVSGLSTGVRAISAGMFHTCALMSTGAVRCWGRNGDGQLGRGNIGGNSNQAGDVTGLGAPAMAIALGSYHSCALMGNRTVRCWGANGQGELGNGIGLGSAAPVSVAGISGVAAIASGEYHTCVSVINAGARCWGRNVEGQLGNGTVSSAPGTVPVSGLAQIVAGLEHNVAVTLSGAAWAWGSNAHGRLGNSSVANSSMAVRVGLDDIVAVAAGNFHTLALTTDGTVWAWGGNLTGALGYDTRDVCFTAGSQPCSIRPRPVPGLTNIVAISAGNSHSMALRSDGTVWTWGDNAVSQLGRTNAAAAFTVPGQVTGTGTVAGIAAGAFHSVALLSGGSLVAWGKGSNGEIGNGGSSNAAAPAAVSTLSNVVALSAGGAHTLAMRSDNTVWGWGWNRYGQVGNANAGTPPANQLVPIQLPNMTNVAEISAGYSASIARKHDQTVWTWGLSHLQHASLSASCGATGGASCARVPTQNGTLTGAIAIAEGGGHTVTVRPDDSLVNIGRNVNLQLGNTSPGYGSLGFVGDPLFYDPNPGSAGPICAGVYCKLIPPNPGSLGITSTSTGVNFTELGASVTFGRHLAGTASSPVTLLVSNGSTVGMSISSVNIDGDFTLDHTCASFASNGRCDINIVFTPSAGGTRNGTLTIRTSRDDSPVIQISTVGFGLAPPGAPASVTASAGDARAVASFTAPADDGASAITSFTARCIGPTTVQQQGSSSPITVTGLTNGVAYTCSVQATNANGSGPFSSGASVTPAAPPVALNVTKAGTGTGTVSSSPAGINCGSTCSANFGSGSSVTLTAAPSTGATFAGWSGACTGTATCQVTLSSAMSVTATFTASPTTLTIAKAGTGAGTVTSNPAGINCGTTCSATFDGASSVTLTPAAATGSTFAGWSGSCTGTGLCQVTLNAATTVTATFTAIPTALTIAKAGSGTGTVTSSPTGINCGTSCSVNFGGGSVVTLTATPASGSQFAGWSGGGCGGTSTCQVTMTAAITVTATFNVTAPGPAALTVTKAGSGAGVVTSSPAGINCGTTCTASFNGGAMVTLAAAPSTGSNFAGWSGACTGTGTCQVTMTAAMSVTATFDLPSSALTIVKAGSGAGIVTSSPSGISCGATCSANFNAGSTVTLTATPSTGSNFAGWTGACSGTATCQVAMTAAMSATATFNLLPALNLSAQSVDFGGQSLQTTSVSRNVTLTNSGGAALTLSSIGASAPFATTHNCGSTLAAGGTCTVSVSFTPSAAGSVTGAITVQASTGTATVQLAGVGERSLVTHYYRSILNRTPDAEGKGYWESEAARLSTLGANINEVWFVMAGYFFNSTEYLAANKTNAQFVTDLYNTFFNRPPDAGGLGYWTNQIQGGLPREVVLFSFMFSPEFAAFTQGIFGNTSARPEVNVVMDFFRGVLNRLPDTDAFNYWVRELRTAQCQGAGAVYAKVGTMSASFIFSTEYNNRTRNNTQYVTDMYYSFLRRGGDTIGVGFWINQLNTNGKDRNTTRTDFIASPEFGARVQSVIGAGCVP